MPAEKTNTSRYNTVTSITRLNRDYMKILKDPVPYVVAHPLPNNMLEWHYVFQGPEGSPYENGFYHGILKFPIYYPFKPPSIYMLTPNGRFECNKPICLSITDYHVDTWNPTWNASSILTALLSFMLEEHPAIGTIKTSDKKKHLFAKQSWSFNLQNKIFCRLFPEIVHESLEKIKYQNAETFDAKPMVLHNASLNANGFGTNFLSTLFNAIVIIATIGFFYVMCIRSV